MSFEFIVLILAVVTGFAGLFFMLRRREAKLEKPEENQALLMLQNQINEMARILDSKILESTKMMQTQTSEISQSMQKIIRQIAAEIRVQEHQVINLNNYFLELFSIS